MRGTLIFTALLLAAPVALAQQAEPTVNDSDYDTTPPADDQAYLDDAQAGSTGEPTLSDSDFDTGVPADDTAYLDQAAAEAEAEGATNGAGSSASNKTPGIGGLALVVTLGLVAFATRRR